MKCKSCGKELLNFYNYCPYCGYHQQLQFFCSRCGTSLSSDMIFCYKCGNRIKNIINESSQNKCVEKSSKNIDIEEIINNKDSSQLVFEVDKNGRYRSVCEAVDSASDGDIIYVNSGDYVENLILNKAVTIIGAQKDLTKLELNSNCFITNNVTIKNISFIQGKEHSNTNIRNEGLINISSNVSIINCNVFDSFTNGIVIKDKGNLSLEESNIKKSRDNNISILDSGKLNCIKSEILESGMVGIKIESKGTVSIQETSIGKSKTLGIEISEKAQVEIENVKIFSSGQSCIIINGNSTVAINKSKFYEGDRDFPLIWVRSNADPFIENCDFYNNKNWGILRSEEAMGCFRHCTFKISSKEIKNDTNYDFTNVE